MAVILVVDDDKGILKFVRAVLASAGHQTFSATNGLEAVAVFRSNQATIELVITDMRMPVMGGAEAVARIRENNPTIPVICMTGYTDEAIPQRAVVLYKPVTAQKLLDLTSRLLAT